ncbi:MAG: TetR/AcrR family transcriptional regulator [Mesorhizobium sp.]|nr:TetR/AcrR family transcriptional regulator [Mesorhizobium sp.]
MIACTDHNTPTGDRRRAAIAAAARALIAERGFEGLRTRDIAARAGINVATMHYHVPSKEALVALVAQSLRDDFIAQHNARPRAGLSAGEILRLEIADFRETREHNIDLFRVMAEMMEKARRDENIAAAMRPMQGFWHRQIVDILARGVAEGDFRADLDPQAGATIFLGALIGTMRHPDPTSAHFDRVAAEIARAFGLGPSQPALPVAKA